MKAVACPFFRGHSTGVQLKFLPPYSPELNPVERLWQDIKDALGV